MSHVGYGFAAMGAAVAIVGLLPGGGLGCGGGGSSPAVGGSSAQRQSLRQQTETEGLLAFVNDQAQTDFERLDVDCALRSDSARQVIRHRDGKDGVPETPDDDLFDTLQELDAVRMVGPATLEKLGECARRFGYITAGPWDLLLALDEPGASQVAVAELPGGKPAVFHRAFVSSPGGNIGTSVLRTFDGSSWSATRLDEGLPEYVSSYGSKVQDLFDHLLAKGPSGSSQLVAGVLGRYSTSVLSSEGQLYALFLRAFDGQAWGEWHRVTPVGGVFNVALDVDESGVAHFAWSSATNLEAGRVFLSSFDATTGTTGEIIDLDAASQFLSFQSVDVVCAPSGDVWVTYRGTDGLFAVARHVDGSLAPRQTIASVSWPPMHAATWADGALWVVTDEPGLPVYRVQDGVIATVVNDLFVGYAHETESDLESLDYGAPSISARPHGGVAIAAGRSHHYESFGDPAKDFDRQSVVARQMTFSGDWSPEQILYVAGTWSNVGGAMATGEDAVWVAGAAPTATTTLFVVRSAGE